MDFRRKNGFLDHDKVEVWFHVNKVPEIGVLEIDGDKCYFNSYADTADDAPLYLFSFVDEDVIQDMRNGRVDALTGFSHHSALIFKEVELEESGKIEAYEVNFRDLKADELPEPGAFFV